MFRRAHPKRRPTKAREFPLVRDAPAVGVNGHNCDCDVSFCDILFRRNAMDPLRSPQLSPGAQLPSPWAPRSSAYSRLPPLLPSLADPRYGNLGFLPKKRCRRGRGRCKAFPKDDSAKKPHLTAFIGFKAGMTHIMREVERPGSKMHKKEIIEPVTILETPAMSE